MDPFPWVVGDVVELGAIALADGKLAGGDPWRTGADDGFPWTIDTGADRVVVRIVVAVHPLGGRECAAIEALVEDRGPVVEWVPEAGYGTAVGAAGVGAPAAFDNGAVFEIDPPMSPAPRWHALASEGTAAPDLALCTVAPQGQLCRTWTGRDSDGRVAAVVTDLGLLEIDLAIDGVRPWDAPSRESG